MQQTSLRSALYLTGDRQTSYRSNIYRKLDVPDRRSAAAKPRRSPLSTRREVKMTGKVISKVNYTAVCDSWSLI